MIDGVRAVVTWFFSQVSAIWVAYTVLPIVSAFFAIWVLDRIFHIFDILKR